MLDAVLIGKKAVFDVVCRGKKQKNGGSEGYRSRQESEREHGAANYVVYCRKPRPEKAGPPSELIHINGGAADRLDGDTRIREKAKARSKCISEQHAPGPYPQQKCPNGENGNEARIQMRDERFS